MKLKLLLYTICLLAIANCSSKKKGVQVIEKPKVALIEVEPVELPPVKEERHIKKLKKTNGSLKNKTLEYIEKYASLAVLEMHKHKIPASIKLAQAILESGSGVGELALKSNNHFGIKCHRQWKGERVYHDDDIEKECFRKYENIKASYSDHSKFLTQRKWYFFLFDYNIKDYKSWAFGLKKAGYATDIKYSIKLINIIETYKLYEFDKVKIKGFAIENNTKKESSLKRKKQKNHKVKKGDTLYSISIKYNTTVEELKRLNNLKSNKISIGYNLRIN